MNDKLVDAVAEALSQQAGLSFDGTMRERLCRCMRSRARAEGVPVDDYAARAGVDPAVRQALIQDVTVQESSFFRDPGQFQALTAHVLPGLAGPVRIWSAGCARGQEPYSLAMVLLEDGHRDASVIATDISAEALAVAEAGRYPEGMLGGLSAGRRAMWTVADGPQWRVRDEVRRRVHFARHNIAADDPPFPPGQCQVVFCRNVLIYFQPAARTAVLDRIFEWLPPSGMLFLGFAESLWRVTDKFELVPLGEAFGYRKPGPASPRPAPPEPAAERRPPPAPAGPAAPGRADVSALLSKGELAMAASDPGAAAAAFRQAVYLDGTHPLAHFQLGLALEAQGQAASAARAFRAARTALRRVDPAALPAGLFGYRPETLVRMIDAKLAEVDR